MFYFGIKTTRILVYTLPWTIKTRLKYYEAFELLNLLKFMLFHSEYFEDINWDIFALKEIGYMLLGMQH